MVNQHRSPDFIGCMKDLLGRGTDMAIHCFENGMIGEPSSVYLNPPGMKMVITDRELLLTEKGEVRTLSHPIDPFFRSLASDVGR